jgi:hypothetical protein
MAPTLGSTEGCGHASSAQWTFGFTGAEYADWCREAGFRDVEILPPTHRPTGDFKYSLF